MKTIWILDVLEDLKSFALANGLPVLAEHLDDARLIAATEIASQQQKGPSQGYGKAGASGQDFGKLGQHHQA